MFKVKSNMLETWNRLIPRADKKLSDKSVVCHRHFDERYLVKTFDHVINGERVSIDRGKWKLTDDAVPTLFPGCPKYLSKQMPKPRTCPTKRREAAAMQLKQLKQQQQQKRKSSSTSVFDVRGNVSSVLGSQSRPKQRMLSTVPRPEVVATEIVTVEMSPATVDMEFLWECEPPPPERTMVPPVVTSTTKSSPLEITLKRKVSRITSRYNKLKQKMKLVKTELMATRKELLDVKGKTITKEMMDELPERQRNVIEHIVLMSRCSQKQQIRFDSSWMLDCLILRTRSASEYEFLRDNAFLPLPSRTTLARHIKAMGTTLGFEELLGRIDEKALDKRVAMTAEYTKTGPPKISLKLRQELAEIVQNGNEDASSNVNVGMDNGNDAEVNMQP